MGTYDVSRSTRNAWLWCQSSVQQPLRNWCPSACKNPSSSLGKYLMGTKEKKKMHDMEQTSQVALLEASILLNNSAGPHACTMNSHMPESQCSHCRQVSKPASVLTLPTATAPLNSQQRFFAPALASFRCSHLRKWPCLQTSPPSCFIPSPLFSHGNFIYSPLLPPICLLWIQSSEEFKFCGITGRHVVQTFWIYQTDYKDLLCSPSSLGDFPVFSGTRELLRQQRLPDNAYSSPKSCWTDLTPHSTHSATGNLSVKALL